MTETGYESAYERYVFCQPICRPYLYREKTNSDQSLMASKYLVGLLTFRRKKTYAPNV